MAVSLGTALSAHSGGNIGAKFQRNCAPKLYLAPARIARAYHSIDGNICAFTFKCLHYNVCSTPSFALPFRVKTEAKMIPNYFSHEPNLNVAKDTAFIIAWPPPRGPR